MKSIWDVVKNVAELDADAFHGVNGTHEHKWYGDVRGPARLI